jgi:hypothetical protein
MRKTLPQQFAHLSTGVLGSFGQHDVIGLPWGRDCKAWTLIAVHAAVFTLAARPLTGYREARASKLTGRFGKYLEWIRTSV